MAQFRGIAFPFQKGPDSFPAKVEDEELIRQSILQIMSTTRGERVMRPEFGSNVFKFVFANNTEFLATLIAAEAEAAIARFEPRVTVTNTRTEREESFRGSEIIITVEYVIKATGLRQTVEFNEVAPR